VGSADASTASTPCSSDRSGGFGRTFGPTIKPTLSWSTSTLSSVTAPGSSGATALPTRPDPFPFWLKDPPFKEVLLPPETAASRCRAAARSAHTLLPAGVAMFESSPGVPRLSCVTSESYTSRLESQAATFKPTQAACTPRTVVVFRRAARRTRGLQACATNWAGTLPAFVVTAYYSICGTSVIVAVTSHI
jgi:hypothetical protein